MQKRGRVSTFHFFEQPAPLTSRAFSGKFIVRVPPEAHGDPALKAGEKGVSLNRLVSTKLSRS